MKTTKQKRHRFRNDPLQTQMEKDTSLKIKPEKIKKITETNDYLDAKTSKRILNLVQEQQEEIEKQDKIDNIEMQSEEEEEEVGVKTSNTFKYESTDDDEEEYEEEDIDLNIDLDVDEMALMDKFMTKEPKKQLDLAQLIMNKINLQKDSDPLIEIPPINPKIVEVYTKLGSLLSRYKSGRLPKAFKIIPSLSNWEDILMITNPQTWTPNATFEATKMFVSNFKSKMAQRFLNLILLEKVREDVYTTKKLNCHLYQALKKSLYKPAAFFKGILIPLCESGSCTLKEAAIFGSVLSKVSVPMLHSAAALLKLSELEYTGPNSFFIRVLLDKKYALPYKVIDALVFHFLQFKTDTREMPVLWHQSFLVFCQRYKEDLTPEQKDALIQLIKSKNHPSISSEILRELQNSKCRGDIMEMEM